MKQQTSITVSGTLGACIRQLVTEFPGVNVNRIGRAIIRLGLQRACKDRGALIAALRDIDSPWAPPAEVTRAK